MKKIIVLFGIVVIILVIAALAQAGKLNDFFNLNLNRKSSAVTINSAVYNVRIADTEEARVKGLSGTKKLNENAGMLFVFPEKGKHQFWMKDMQYPIDIIFINDDTITDISKNAQPIQAEEPSYTLYGPTTDVNYVLEINAGEADKKNIKVGDKVTIQR